MDAGNMLKPMLARGELRMVGATTLDEYREHIEKDPALERRFQPVVVGEPTVEDTIGILRGLKGRYEAHHRVQITDAALVAAAGAVRPLHQRPVPARQGHRPDRRGRLPAAHGDRLPPGRAGPAAARRSTGCAMEKLALAQGDRPGVARPAGPARARPRRPRGGADRPQRPVGPRARRPQPGRRAEEAARRGRAPSWSARSATPTGRRPSRLQYQEIPALEARARERVRGRGRDDRAADGQGRGRRRRHRRGHRRRGPASRPAGCWRARPPSCCGWRSRCRPRWSARPRPWPRSPERYAGPAPASPTRTARPAASCSSARPASARPSWPRRWPASSSTTSGPWSAST